NSPKLLQAPPCNLIVITLQKVSSASSDEVKLLLAFSCWSSRRRGTSVPDFTAPCLPERVEHRVWRRCALLPVGRASSALPGAAPPVGGVSPATLTAAGSSACLKRRHSRL